MYDLKINDYWIFLSLENITEKILDFSYSGAADLFYENMKRKIYPL